MSTEQHNAASERFGYKADLPVSLSMVSILGLSFGIMAVPYGLSTTMLIGLTDGGPVTIIYGWVLVMLISGCIAASLGELSSVYPTSGGIYFWSAKTAPRGAAAPVSYVAGWLTMLGNWLILLSINFGGASLVMSAPSIWNPDYVPETYQVVLVFWAINFSCALINILPNKFLDALNHACMYWTAASVLIILVTVLAMGKGGRRSGAFAFGDFTNRSGYPDGWAFFIGLLQPSYVITAYGMIASLAEETSNPQTEVAKAMTLSVFFGAITGLFYLVPLMFVLPDVAELLSTPTGQPIGLIFASATGSPSGGFGLLFLIFGILAFAGIGAMTAASRSTYAFSRDNALPLSRWWRSISPRFGQPVNSIVLVTTVTSLLGLIYLGSAAAFNAFSGCGTMCLTAAYNVPIFMSVLSRRRHVKDAVWSLGKFGWAINLVSVLWVPLACVLFSSPTAIPTTPTLMNYASVIFVFFGLFATVYYIGYGRSHFKGPALDEVEAVRKSDLVGKTSVQAGDKEKL